MITIQSAPRLKQRSVIKLFMAEKCKSSQIYRNICDLYEEACFSQKITNRRKDGRNCIQDVDETHRPTIANTPEMDDSVNALVLAYKVVQWRTFLSNFKFLWIQYTRLCMMNLTFLRSFIVSFY